MTLILPATYGHTTTRAIPNLRGRGGQYEKPQPWAWSPSKIDPKWWGMLNGILTIHPFWDIQGTDESHELLHNYLCDQQGGAGTYTVGPGRYGQALIADVDHVPYFLFGKIGTSYQPLPYGDPVTLITVLDNVADGGSSNILHDNYLSPNGWMFRLEQYNNTGYLGVTKAGFTGGNGDLTCSHTFASITGRFVVVGMTMGPDQDWEPHVWVDGVKAVCGSGTSTAAPSGSQTNGVAYCGENGYLNADIYADYIWNRVLSDGEMQEISADPFGLIRPVAVPQRVPVLEPKRRFFSVPAQIAESKRTAKPLIFYPQVHPDWREGLCAATFGIGGDVVDVWRGPATKTTAPLDLATAGFGRWPYFSGPSETGGTEEEVEWPYDALIEPTTAEITVACLWQYGVADNDAADATAIFGKLPESSYKFGIFNHVWNSYRETGFVLTISGTERWSDYEGITPAVAADVPLLMVGRWRSGDYLTLHIYRYDTRTWAWGPLNSASTYSGVLTWPSTKAGLTIGQHPLAATNFVRGAFGAGYFWSRYISDAEMDTLAADPYAPFRMSEPLRIAIPYDFVVTEEAPAGVTLDQEGYRWRLDDNDEATATWLAAQDINITRQKSLNTRIRIIVNATGDPDSETYQIEYREKDSGDPWRKIE